MDLTSQLDALGPRRINLVLEALLSSDLRLKILLVSANRLGLMVSALRLKARRLLVGAMTTEGEALPYLMAGLPGLLLCSDRLEAGDSYSMVRQARLLVPDIRIMMILEEANPDVAEALRSDVDAIIFAGDIGDPSQPVSHGACWPLPIIKPISRPRPRCYSSANPQTILSTPSNSLNAKIKFFQCYLMAIPNS